MKFRIMSWIPVEPDEDEEQEYIEELPEAIAELKHHSRMQPENIYEIQLWNEEEKEWVRVPAWMYAAIKKD